MTSRVCGRAKTRKENHHARTEEVQPVGAALDRRGGLPQGGNDVVMIPVGSCEKHGSHVPWASIPTRRWGAWSGRHEGQGALCAPVTLWPSLTDMGEPGWGTGSISFPAEIYRQVLYAIGRSLIFAGFNKLVYVSHHGTNMGAQGEVLRTLRAETGCFCAYYKTPTERECAVVADLMTGPAEERPVGMQGNLRRPQRSPI